MSDSQSEAKRRAEARKAKILARGERPPRVFVRFTNAFLAIVIYGVDSGHGGRLIDR
jgi:ribosomal protein L18